MGDQPVQMALTLSGTGAQGRYYYDAVGAPLDLEGMVTVVEPYAVGPYAQGTFFVTVPFGALKAVIDPEEPLSVFVN